MKRIFLRSLSPSAVLMLLVIAGCQQQAGTNPGRSSASNTEAKSKPSQNAQNASSPQTAADGQTLREITLEVTGMS